MILKVADMLMEIKISSYQMRIASVGTRKPLFALIQVSLKQFLLQSSVFNLQINTLCIVDIQST